MGGGEGSGLHGHWCDPCCFYVRLLRMGVVRDEADVCLAWDLLGLQFFRSRGVVRLGISRLGFQDTCAGRVWAPPGRRGRVSL